MRGRSTGEEKTELELKIKEIEQARAAEYEKFAAAIDQLTELYDQLPRTDAEKMKAVEELLLRIIEKAKFTDIDQAIAQTDNKLLTVCFQLFNCRNEASVILQKISQLNQQATHLLANIDDESKQSHNEFHEKQEEDSNFYQHKLNFLDIDSMTKSVPSTEYNLGIEPNQIAPIIERIFSVLGDVSQPDKPAEAKRPEEGKEEWSRHANDDPEIVAAAPTEYRINDDILANLNIIAKNYALVGNNERKRRINNIEHAACQRIIAAARAINQSVMKLNINNLSPTQSNIFALTKSIEEKSSSSNSFELIKYLRENHTISEDIEFVTKNESEIGHLKIQTLHTCRKLEKQLTELNGKNRFKYLIGLIESAPDKHALETINSYLTSSPTTKAKFELDFEYIMDSDGFTRDEKEQAIAAYENFDMTSITHLNELESGPLDPVIDAMEVQDEKNARTPTTPTEVEVELDDTKTARKKHHQNPSDTPPSTKRELFSACSKIMAKQEKGDPCLDDIQALLTPDNRKYFLGALAKNDMTEQFKMIYQKSHQLMALAFIKYDKKNFEGILINQFYDKNFSSKNNESTKALAPDLTAMSNFIGFNILNSADIDQAAFAIDYWINTAYECAFNPDMKDFFGALAIYGAFGNQVMDIYELLVDKNILANSTVERFNQIRNLYSSSRNFTNLRKAVMSDEHAIPHIGLIFQDQIVTSEANNIPLLSSDVEDLRKRQKATRQIKLSGNDENHIPNLDAQDIDFNNIQAVHSRLDYLRDKIAPRISREHPREINPDYNLARQMKKVGVKSSSTNIQPGSLTSPSLSNSNQPNYPRFQLYLPDNINHRDEIVHALSHLNWTKNPDEHNNNLPTLNLYAAAEQLVSRGKQDDHGLLDASPLIRAIALANYIMEISITNPDGVDKLSETAAHLLTNARSLMSVSEQNEYHHFITSLPEYDKRFNAVDIARLSSEAQYFNQLAQFPMENQKSLDALRIKQEQLQARLQKARAQMGESNDSLSHIADLINTSITNIIDEKKETELPAQSPEPAPDQLNSIDRLFSHLCQFLSGDNLDPASQDNIADTEMAVKKILKSTSVIIKKDKDGNLLLHLAVISNNVEIINALLKAAEKGHNKQFINSKNNEGNTPLHLAVKSGNLELVKLLVERGAKTTITNKQGLKAYDYALASNLPHVPVINPIKIYFDELQEKILRELQATQESQADRFLSLVENIIHNVRLADKSGSCANYLKIIANIDMSPQEKLSAMEKFAMQALDKRKVAFRAIEELRLKQPAAVVHTAIQQYRSNPAASIQTLIKLSGPKVDFLADPAIFAAAAKNTVTRLLKTLPDNAFNDIGKSPSFTQLINLSDPIRDIVHLSILAEESPGERAKRYEFFCNAIKSALANEDFYTAATIFGALNNPVIRCLSETLNLVSPQDLHFMQSIYVMIGSGKFLSEFQFKNSLTTVSDIPVLPNIPGVRNLDNEYRESINMNLEYIFKNLHDNQFEPATAMGVKTASLLNISNLISKLDTPLIEEKKTALQEYIVSEFKKNLSEHQSDASVDASTQSLDDDFNEKYGRKITKIVDAAYNIVRLADYMQALQHTYLTQPDSAIQHTADNMIAALAEHTTTITNHTEATSKKIAATETPSQSKDQPEINANDFSYIVSMDYINPRYRIVLLQSKLAIAQREGRVKDVAHLQSVLDEVHMQVKAEPLPRVPPAPVNRLSSPTSIKSSKSHESNLHNLSGDIKLLLRDLSATLDAICLQDKSASPSDISNQDKENYVKLRTTATKILQKNPDLVSHKPNDPIKRLVKMLRAIDTVKDPAKIVSDLRKNYQSNKDELLTPAIAALEEVTREFHAHLLGSLASAEYGIQAEPARSQLSEQIKSTEDIDALKLIQDYLATPLAERKTLEENIALIKPHLKENKKNDIDNFISQKNIKALQEIANGYTTAQFALLAAAHRIEGDLNPARYQRLCTAILNGNNFTDGNSVKSYIDAYIKMPKSERDTNDQYYEQICQAIFSDAERHQFTNARDNFDFAKLNSFATTHEPALDRPKLSTLISEEVDIYQYPSVDATPPDKNQTLTIGDMHASSMKFLYFLAKHKVIEISQDDYAAMVAIYRNHIDYYLNYHDIYIPLINSNKSIDAGLKKDELTIINNISALKNNFAADFSVISLKSMTSDELTNIIASHQSAIKALEDNPAKTPSELTALEKLKLEMNLYKAQSRVRNSKARLLANTEEMKNFENQTADAKKQIAQDLQKFTSILSGLKVNQSNLRLIGDELSDRGANDIFILKILKKLRGSCQVETLLSNHGIAFIDNQEQHNVDLIETLNVSQASSSYMLLHLIEQGILTAEEVATLTKEAYLPTLKIVGYTLNEDSTGINLYSHAPIDIEVIRAIATKLNVNFNDSSPAFLAYTIDRINEEFQKYVKAGEIHKLYTFKDYSSESLTNEELLIEMHENPFNFAMWNRNTSALQRPDIHPQHSYQVSYTHGHDGASPNALHIFNLDNSLGKVALNKHNRAGTHNNEGLYTVTRTQGNQLSPEQREQMERAENKLLQPISEASLNSRALHLNKMLEYLKMAEHPATPDEIAYLNEYQTELRSDFTKLAYQENKLTSDYPELAGSINIKLPKPLGEAPPTPPAEEAESSAALLESLRSMKALLTDFDKTLDRFFPETKSRKDSVGQFGMFGGKYFDDDGVFHPEQLPTPHKRPGGNDNN